MENKKPIRLTKKTAAALIKQKLGISAAKLEKEANNGSVVNIYELQLGMYIVRISNDWLEHNGLLVLEITDPGGMGTIRKYFHPETLEEDCEAGDRWRRVVREEICEGCPRKESEQKAVEISIVPRTGRNHE